MREERERRKEGRKRVKEGRKKEERDEVGANMERNEQKSILVKVC